MRAGASVGCLVEGRAIHLRRLGPNAEAQAAEWKAVREICCRTGNDGNPIALERWKFFGRLWIEPYEKIFPAWAYIAECNGAIVGYLTGCPDTRAFQRRKFWRFTLPVLFEIARGRYRGNRDAGRFVRQAFRLEKGPELSFARSLSRMLAREYPAHLHMNVEARRRGLGIGRELIDRYAVDLLAAAIEGIHLYCGESALKFYLNSGFQELARIDFHGSPVIALGRRL